MWVAITRGENEIQIYYSVIEKHGPTNYGIRLSADDCQFGPATC
jgi:hypothetical protein